MNIKAIAATLGVSPSTVSRAVSGRGRLSESTRQRVLQRVEEAGYTPNLHARRLVTGRSHVVALDYGNHRRPALADSFLTELTRTLQDALGACGYSLLLSRDRQDVRRLARSRTVDGVVLVADDCAADAAEIAAEGSACVVIGVTPVTGIVGVASVVDNLTTGAQRVAGLFVGEGHRRIAYVGSNARDVVLDAFQLELARLGEPLAPELVLIPGRTPQAGAAAIAELLARPEPPTAVFARTDALAIGILRQARRLGVRVPEALSVVGHDDIPFAELTDPPLTTVRIDCGQLGREAADALVALLDHNRGAAAPRWVETQLVMRESVAPLRRRGDPAAGRSTSHPAPQGFTQTEIPVHERIEPCAASARDGSGRSR